MSVYRTYAQRNNNVTQIIPEFLGPLPNGGPFDISGSAVYVLNIPNIQNAGGIYWVDLSDVDTNGNLLDISGQLFGASNNNAYTHIINFAVNAEMSPSYYPGIEFTIFFKNPPINRLNDNPLLSVAIVSLNGYPYPYIVSPPVPWLTAPNINQSVTFKSDSTAFNVTSSGPAGWFGLPALSILLGALP